MVTARASLHPGVAVLCLPWPWGVAGHPSAPQRGQLPPPPRDGGLWGHPCDTSWCPGRGQVRAWGGPHQLRMGLCSTLCRGLGEELAGLAAWHSFIHLLLPKLLVFNKRFFNERVLLKENRGAAVAQAVPLGLMGHHHLPAERSINTKLYPIAGHMHLSSCSWE